MDRFDACLQFVLEREGRFVNDPTDHGGATNYGITQRTYDTFRKMIGLAVQSVKFITAAEVSTIYRNEYWNTSLANKCAKPLDLFMFDSAVQHGYKRAIKFLQYALGVDADGVAGTATMAALAAAPTETIDLVFKERQDFYAIIVKNDPTQKEFEHGWSNRMDALKKAMA